MHSQYYDPSNYHRDLYGDYYLKGCQKVSQPHLSFGLSVKEKQCLEMSTNFNRLAPTDNKY